jgi:transposase-like protein
MTNSKIDFEHALVAVLDALEYSDNVTQSEFKLVKSLLLKAQVNSQPIKCPHCGSTEVRMVDYEPLAVEDALDNFGQYDNELYSRFLCFDCEESFDKVLEISHQ